MAGVLPVGEDKDGVWLAAVETEDGSLLRCPVVGAFLAEDAEGRGVGARLGLEVPTEAEHVSPVPQAPVRVQGVEVAARGDEPPGVIGDLVAVEFRDFADAVVQGAGIQKVSDIHG